MTFAFLFGSVFFGLAEALWLDPDRTEPWATRLSSAAGLGWFCRH